MSFFFYLRGDCLISKLLNARAGEEPVARARHRRIYRGRSSSRSSGLRSRPLGVIDLKRGICSRHLGVIPRLPRRGPNALIALSWDVIGPADISRTASRSKKDRKEVEVKTSVFNLDIRKKGGIE